MPGTSNTKKKKTIKGDRDGTGEKGRGGGTYLILNARAVDIDRGLGDEVPDKSCRCVDSGHVRSCDVELQVLLVHPHAAAAAVLWVRDAMFRVGRRHEEDKNKDHGAGAGAEGRGVGGADRLLALQYLDTKCKQPTKN